VTPALRAARLVVGLTAVLLPLAHAALRAAGDGIAWPTAIAVIAGLLVRLLAGATPGVAVALALAPVWQVLMSPWGQPGHFVSVMPWLAFLGAVLGWPGPRPWWAEGLWGGAVAAWALVLSLVTPIVAARELDFTLTAAAWPNEAASVLLMAAAQLVALLLFDWYWGATDAARRWTWAALVPGVAAAAGVALWQQSIDPAFLSVEPWLGLRRSAGTFFDANATAALVALVVPILVTPAARPHAVPPVAWGGVWIALGLAGIIATGSRSALAAFVLALGLQALAASRPVRWLALVTGAVLVAVVVAADRVADASTGHAIGRLADSLRRLYEAGAEGVWRFAWDRDGYGPSAMSMIADHPWVGTGPGTFGSLVTGYARESLAMALPPDNAQNWWRQQAAEFGLLGSLPAFGCSLLALTAGVRALARRDHAAAVAPLAGLGLFALVAPPMPHPLLQVIAGLVIAHAVTAAAPPPDAARRVRDGQMIWVLALICAAGSAVTGWQDLRPAYRAARFRTPYSYGVTPVGPTRYGPGRWMDQRGVAVVDPGSHRTLVTRVIVPHEDAATRPVRVVVSGRRGVVCVHEAVDAAPYDCRLPVHPDEWPMVRVEIGRSWPASGGTRRAAVVNAWLDD
jgi:hypothetical protein